VALFGLDWLTMTLPLAGPPEDPPPGLSERSSGRWLRGVPIGGTTAELAVTPWRGGYWARLSFNPARALDPAGWKPCSVFDLHRAAAMAWDAALVYISPSESLDVARVRRLDVTRDFEVANPSFYVANLAPIPRPYAKIVATYRRPQDGASATQMIGSRSGGVCKLYAKTEVATRNILRFEATCRTGWLDRVGIRYLGDVTESRVDALGRDRWAWSRFGTQIGSRVAVVDTVLASDWSSARQERVLGALLIRAYAGGAPSARNSDSRLEADLRVLGHMCATDPGADGDRSCVRRLDLEIGREIITPGPDDRARRLGWEGRLSGA
jgi:hypothetical protein